MSIYPIQTITHPIDFNFSLPGSKSITNRAFLIAMLSNGQTELQGTLESDDTHYMQQALQTLGIQIQKEAHNFKIQGNSGVFTNHQDLNLFLGNAGTATRFLTAAMSLRAGKTILDGNTRMRQRPIQDLIQGLQELGVKIQSLKTNGCPPLEVIGNTLVGGEVTIPGEVSSQYFSAILLCAPYAKKEVTLNVQGELCSKPYIDITLDIMNKFGVQVENHNYQSFKIPQGCYQAQTYTIEGDASAASYFWALVALHGGKVKINNLSLHSHQGDVQFLDVITQMLESDYEIITTESSLEFQVAPHPKLKGLGEIDLNHMPDVAMTLAILAACAQGETIITNVPNMRVKETDRIKAIVTELKKLGIQAEELENGLKIRGRITPQKLLSSVKIETYDDHRMAMCFAVLGTKINGIIINDPECTSKTYPNFWKDLEKI